MFIVKSTYRAWLIAFLLLWCSGCFGQGDGDFRSRIFTSEPEPTVGWDITLTKVLVERAEERRSFLRIPLDDGDEPYFVVVGVKATLGVSGSTFTVPNQYGEKGWAGHMRDGEQKRIPLSMGQIKFRDVTRKDVIGVVVIGIEADMTPWTMIEQRVDLLREELAGVFQSAVESRTSFNRASNGFINELHTSMLAAARLVSDPPTTSALTRRVYSLNDIDDVVGINTMVLMMDRPSEQISYPSYQGGYFTDVLRMQGTEYRFFENALVFENIDKGSRYSTEVRIVPF